MAHNIFGKRFLSVREPAWHGIGKSWTGAKTAAEAVEESGAAEVTIRMMQMGYMIDDGTFTPVEDRKIIMRMPTPDDPKMVRLGEASNDYTVLQNTQIAAALDSTGITKRYPVETCGVLADGATLFLCLDMGKVKIQKEEHRQYATLVETRDGKTKLTLLTSATRVVCQNTLQIALSQGDVKIALAHNEHLESDFNFSLSLIDQVEEQAKKTVAALKALAEIKVTPEQVATVLDATYPVPVKGSLLRNYERVDDPTKFDPATLARLQAMQDRYQYAANMMTTCKDACEERLGVLVSEFPIHKGTALGVFNAVAEIADHTRNGKASAAAITGWRAEEKLRAYNSLITLS
jgi:phage/plasmid-like protein (TIGR03299 family)